MAAFNTICAMLLRGGLTEDEYQGVLPLVRKANHQTVTTLLALVCVLFAGLSLLVFTGGVFETNHTMYLIVCAVALVVFFVERALHERVPAATTAAFYIVVTIAFADALVVGVINAPDNYVITACILVLVVPLVFTDRPWRIFLVDIFMAAACSVCTLAVKDFSYSLVDVVDIACTCAVGVFVGYKCIVLRLTNLSYSRKSDIARQRDGLTGLLNKTSFEERAKGALQDGRCTLLIVDADDFKRVNDLYGHDEGDRVLREMALGIRESFRASDLVGRFGGDEFVVLMVGCVNRGAAVRCAERMIQGLSGRIKLPDANDAFTISVGGAYSDNLAVQAGEAPAGERYAALFKSADAHLYQAKDKGKGCYSLED